MPILILRRPRSDSARPLLQELQWLPVARRVDFKIMVLTTIQMSLEKTEVMWVGHQREELNIRLDGKEIKQVDGFVYFGGMVTEDGHGQREQRWKNIKAAGKGEGHS